jgi:hypothetical protein
MMRHAFIAPPARPTTHPTHRPLRYPTSQPPRSWRATPTFNPVGQQVRAAARYINLRNGEPTAATTDFNSAPATIGGGDDAAGAAPARRRLQQTWGAAGYGSAPQAAQGLVASIYDLNGGAVVVPSTVANGSGVVVSGNSAVHGAVATPIAMSADAAVPVILPSTSRPSVNSGFYVNEAGPAAVSQALDDALSGLQDECADVGDSFVTGDAQVGRVLGWGGRGEGGGSSAGASVRDAAAREPQWRTLAEGGQAPSRAAPGLPLPH